MVFIRPTILRDGFTADQVTARKYDHVRQQQTRNGRRRANDRLNDVMQNYLGPGNYIIPGAVAPTAPVQGEAGALPQNTNGGTE